jgi:predicted DNA-binding protein
MIEEERLRKKKKKVSVLFSTSTNERLDILCDKMSRSKSGLIRLITLEWMDRMLKKG